MPVRLSNGDLLFLQDQAQPVEGYIRDKANARLFHTLHPPCQYRKEQKCAACGGNSRIDYKCTKKDQLNFLDCVTCNLRQP